MSSAAALLRTRWDETWRIQKRPVEQELAWKREKPLWEIRVDEKDIAKVYLSMTLV